MSNASKAQESAAFNQENLLKELAKSDTRYLRFFDNETLSTGIYQLNAGDADEQSPHEWDELYYVLEGKAKLKAGDETFDAIPGAILFVAAKIEHHFFDIEDDLKVLVFFSKADKSPK